MAVAAATPVRADPTPALGLQNPIARADTCSACHTFPNPAALVDEPNVSPMLWQGSLMAHAARDPVFWAAVAIADQDAPGETEDCLRCHAPVAFLEGRGDAIAIDELESDDLEGVGCELCHRMLDDEVTPAGNARYVIDDAAVDGIVPRRGPWDYAPDEPQPSHPWSAKGEHLSSSRMCGTCHDVTTARERLDDDGAPTGRQFNEQRTYSEWLGSAFAQPGERFASCQDCHMPQVDDVPGCEMFALNGQVHAYGRRHELAGANRHMIGLLQAVYGVAAGGDIPDFHFERSIDLVDRTLAAAADLAINAPLEVDLRNGLEDLSVTVTNKTGHKLPTGYSEGRVMWLELVARYGDEVVYGSGRWDADAGIELDAQVRRYEAVAQRWADGQQLHLLANDHWVVDTRIPPEGLGPDPETDPVGDRYALSPQGAWPHTDTAAYAFGPARVIEQQDVPALLDVQVRLLYLINTPAYIELLADDNDTNDAGMRVADLFAEHGAPEPLVVQEAQVAIELRGLVAPPGADSGASSGGLPGTTGLDATAGPDSTAETAGTDTSPLDGEPEPSGCGCRARGRTAWWMMALMLLRVRRRVIMRRGGEPNALVDPSPRR